MIVASAPGKLFVSGEYAVLDRAPALLTAVDVRAVCRLWPSSDGICRAYTSPLAAAPARFRLENSLPVWQDEAVALVDAAWRALDVSRRERLAENAWHIALDTSAFFLKDRKLGLGSSAAALTALSGALWTASGGLPAEAAAFAALQTAHEAWQGGGSGADLAMSLAGGTILYRREPRIAAPVALPASLEILPVWSGAAASTGEFLRRFAEFRQSSPDVLRERLAVLEQAAEEAALAASAGNAGDFAEAFASSGAALRALGATAGLPIWSEPHERIAATVVAAGGIYKPSGAGGGDIGLALVVDDGVTVERVKSAISTAGYRVLPLRFNARGLTVKTDQVEG